MVIVKIELVSAIDPRRSREIGRMVIHNTGEGTEDHGNYGIRLMRRGTTDVVQKTASVENFPRKSAVVWKLVARALKNLGIQ